MKTYHDAILIDGEAQSRVGNNVYTPDPTQAPHYETQVTWWLDNIRESIVGQALIREIMGKPMGKTLRIVPTPIDHKDARTNPSNEADSNPFNKPLRGTGPQTGQPRNGPNGPLLGTGLGANVSIQYNPMTWMLDSLQSGRVGNLMPDDVLVHELLHGLRMMAGKIQTLDMGNPEHTARFGNTEEFYALMVANIYVSERNQPKGGLPGRNQVLRGNIGPVNQFRALTAEEARSENFLRQYRTVIKPFCEEMLGLTHGGGQKGLQHSPAQFNPIRDYFKEQEELQAKYYGGLWMRGPGFN